MQLNWVYLVNYMLEILSLETFEISTENGNMSPGKGTGEDRK